MKETKCEFDAPLVIERNWLRYKLKSQDIKSVSYEGLRRLNAKQHLACGKILETSKSDLRLRIEQGDIDVVIPSQGYFKELEKNG